MINSSLPNITYRPYLFYGLVFLISWVNWFVSAYFSYHENRQVITLFFAFLGLLGPVIVSLLMVFLSGNNLLFNDYRQRLLRGFIFSLSHTLIIVAIIILTLFVATFISLLFGFSPDQFKLSGNFFIMLPFALVAATFEELGWRTYGIDSLLINKTLFSASLRFAILWGLWHLPLFFINLTYQQSLYQLGPLYVINFFVSLLPATILANWFYYRCHRSIPAAILFHFLLVASSELLQTAPQTKWIITALLLVICLILVLIERQFFITKISLSTHPLPFIK